MKIILMVGTYKIRLYIDSRNFIEKIRAKFCILLNIQYIYKIVVELGVSLAVIVSETKTKIVQKALETIPTGKIYERFQKNIGRSVQAKRVEINTLIKKKEQKWNQEFVF